LRDARRLSQVIDLEHARVPELFEPVLRGRGDFGV
jgi:hypothetical protein